jgi:hypothetical protein
MKTSTMFLNNHLQEAPACSPAFRPSGGFGTDPALPGQAKAWTTSGGRTKACYTHRFRSLLALFLLVAALGVARAQDTVTQNFTLHPGWNAIWLEVLPTNTAVSAVFAGVPIESVWTFQQRLSAVDFIQDPNEPVWNKDQWLVYVPTNRPESFQNNLYNLQVNRAYLVKLLGNSNTPLAITGRPSLRVPEWVPNAYNLRGFPLDPAGPAPSFLNYFRPSAAHCDASTGTLQKIYRLSTAGQWRLVAPADSMRAGEACWVYTQGASDYQGPLAVRLDFGDALDYGYGVDRLSLTFQNQAAGPVTVTLSSLGGAAPLSYYNLDLVAGVQWIPLPSPQAIPLAASEKRTLRLAARRPDMTDESFASVLAVGDGGGVRYLVPVKVSKVTTATLASQSVSKIHRSHLEPASSEESHVGLWVGTATITNVSEAHGGVLVTNMYAYVGGQPVVLTSPGIFPYTNVWTSLLLGQTVTNREVRATNAAGQQVPVLARVERQGAGQTPTPTGSQFNLRLIVHVDAAGQARLLKEVIQMWKEGTYTNAPDGWKVMATNGNYVLVTDETLLAQFRGAAVRDGQDVGRRISTVDFDFPSTATNSFLPLSGSFAGGGTLAGTITLPADFPTNPFRHKYHTNHTQGYVITRNLELTFSSDNTTGRAQPGYGYDVFAGAYRETVSGLHKSNIVATGTFTLNRVDVTPTLNQ